MKEVNRELFDIDTSIVYVIGLSEVLYNFQLLFDLKIVLSAFICNDWGQIWNRHFVFKKKKRYPKRKLNCK